ncbi:MAG: hypothetical protein WCJ30_11450 [Deltaproteobacteria bacterium]
MDWYVRSFALCSPWSYLLLGGQCILLAMLIERVAFLFIASAINVDMFLAQIRKLVLAGNADRALKLTSAAGERPLARVCLAGLAALDRGPFALQEAVDRAIAGELPTIIKRVSAFPLIAVFLAGVGVVGSKLLGATARGLQGDGPLPFGLAMELAPAVIGLASGFVGLAGWLWVSRGAQKAIETLEKTKAMLLDVGGTAGQRGPLGR